MGRGVDDRRVAILAAFPPRRHVRPPRRRQRQGIRRASQVNLWPVWGAFARTHAVGVSEQTPSRLANFRPYKAAFHPSISARIPPRIASLLLHQILLRVCMPSGFLTPMTPAGSRHAASKGVIRHPALADCSSSLRLTLWLLEGTSQRCLHRFSAGEKQSRGHDRERPSLVRSQRFCGRKAVARRRCFINTKKMVLKSVSMSHLHRQVAVAVPVL